MTSQANKQHFLLSKLDTFRASGLLSERTNIKNVNNPKQLRYL